MNSAMVLVAAGVAGYLKYNEKKEESELNRGYPDPSRVHYGGRNANHQVIDKRVVLARCIYGMYYRGKGQPEYRQWWNDLHYDLIPNEVVLGDDSRHYPRELKQERIDQYFGVLQRRMYDPSVLRHQDAPRWIVAVRGTDIWNVKDLWHDAKIFLGMLGERDFKLLEAVIRRIVRDYGPKSVIVTGHSLGASAGMLVGRRLAMEGTYIETHLFNPPYITLMEIIRLKARPLDDCIRHRLQRGEVLIQEERNNVEKLGEWAPNMYVNTNDLITKRFFDYFIKEPVASCTRLSDGIHEMEAFHLLPRAVLHISSKHKLRIVSAHMLWNWARPDLPYQISNVNLIGQC